MTIVRPDFDRRIDLVGTGPCPRPVDIDQAQTGFAKLVSLRVYSFADGMVIDGEAERDEVFVVLMRGQADVAVDAAGARVGDFSLSPDGGSRAVYLPPHAAYRLTAKADCDIAYARVQPSGSQLRGTGSFAPVEDRLDVSDYATGMELALATIPTGGRFELTDATGQSPERFVHIRSDDGGTAAVSGERIGDWESLVLRDGARATIEVENGSVDILTISASARGGMSAKTD